MNNEIIYEFPLNERMRVFIRLEQLFLQLDHFLVGTTAWDRRIAIGTLLNIMTIFSRNDIKLEILKELERHSLIFNQISQNEDVDTAKLTDIMDELDEISKKLFESNGKVSLALMKCNLFQMIAQRSTIPGGTCSFDLPAFHYWLEQEEHIQAKHLARWTKPLTHLREAINLILNFIRHSSHATSEIATAGFYQSSLNSAMPYQLLRVGVDRAIPCYAEISGGKHRFTIRFMSPPEDANRPAQTADNIPFNLTCCLF